MSVTYRKYGRLCCMESTFHWAASRGAVGRNCLAQVGTMPITFGGVVGEIMQDCAIFQITLANNHWDKDHNAYLSENS